MDKVTAYGCIFCLTGKELSVAENIRNVCKDICAVAVQQEKYKSVGGVKSRVMQTMLPGYVFFSAPDQPDAINDIPRMNIVRILKDGEGNWQLGGTDREFARWTLEYNGVIGFSRAYQEGERIRILSSPLKDMEGLITRIDRRGRSGQIAVPFNGREIRLWLGFDLVEPAAGTQGGDGK